MDRSIRLRDAFLPLSHRAKASSETHDKQSVIFYRPSYANITTTLWTKASLHDSLHTHTHETSNEHKVWWQKSNTLDLQGELWICRDDALTLNEAGKRQSVPRLAASLCTESRPRPLAGRRLHVASVTFAAGLTQLQVILCNTSRWKHKKVWLEAACRRSASF